MKSTSILNASHPNSRFTAPAENCPCLSSEYHNPNGVPISAMLFGGRRAKTAPLVYQSRDWKHGVFVGSIMGSEKTAASAAAPRRMIPAFDAPSEMRTKSFFRSNCTFIGSSLSKFTKKGCPFYAPFKHHNGNAFFDSWLFNQHAQTTRLIDCFSRRV